MQRLSLRASAQGRGLLLWAHVRTTFHGHAPASHSHGDHPGEQASQLPAPNEGLLREQRSAESAHWRSAVLQQRDGAGPGTGNTHTYDTRDQWCSQPAQPQSESQPQSQSQPQPRACSQSQSTQWPWLSPRPEHNTPSEPQSGSQTPSQPRLQPQPQAPSCP